MMSDAYKKEYENYDELHEYMHGSASVVGMMMTYIVGFEDGALEYADALGDAFQLTNFLRDIDEDYHQKRGRVYMPKDYMKQFGLSADMIKNRRYDDHFVQFMKFMIEKNREIYQIADKGIPMLRSYRARLGVTIARLLYSHILNKIENIEYNVFKGRVHVSKWKRLVLVAWAPVYLLMLDFKYLLKKLTQK
jgi:phytoene synthase